MPMYRQRPELADTHNLDQGDILANVLVPVAPVGMNFALVRNKNKLDWPARADSLRDLDPELRAVCPIRRLEHAIVLSNSCDNEGEYLIHLAPIRDFRFSKDDLSERDQWLDISEAATGTAAPKLFYLPGDERFGLNRSEARLIDMVGLQHSFLQRGINEGGTRRVCGLTPEAQRHLQWAIGLMYSRNSREDMAWPSDDDLRLKLVWLDDEIPRSGDRRAALEAERAAIRKQLGIMG